MALDVLIVEDSPVMRRIIVRNLRAARASLKSVFEAESAEMGLGLLGRGVRPHLILSDYYMVGMNGIEFIQRVRESMSQRGASILMISSESRPEIIQEAHSAGANGYITKPFTVEILGQHLERLKLA